MNLDFKLSKEIAFEDSTRIEIMPVVSMLVQMVEYVSNLIDVFADDIR
jgi:hypothetical protein